MIQRPKAICGAARTRALTGGGGTSFVLVCSLLGFLFSSFNF